MKRRQWFKSAQVALTFLLVAAISTIAAEFNLGKYAFPVGPPSPPLQATVSPIALASYSFVGEVGGVAFGQIAAPESGFAPSKVAIDYDATQPDGNRLRVWFDDEPCAARLPDWLLVPITAFANSEFNASVSLFGPQTTDTMYDIIYHPALQNTLLGLRLLQADILLMDLDETWKLPTQNGLTPLGLGEKDSSMSLDRGSIVLEWRGGPMGRAANVVGPYQTVVGATSPMTIIAERQSEFYRVLGPQFDVVAANRISEAIAEDDFRSWVLTDVDTQLRFGKRNLRLHFFGEQYYHFWDSDFDAYEREVDRLLALANAVRNDIPAYNAIIDQINALEPKVTPITNSIANLKRNTDALQKQNPVVFNAAQTTMQYAAFFRYVKGRNPANWTAYVGKTRNVQPKPHIETPTRWRGPF